MAEEKRGRGKPKGYPRSGGKVKGQPTKTTLAAQALLDGEAERLTRKCIDLAHEGNQVALKLVMERMIPPRKILEIEGGLTIQIEKMTDDELDEQIRRLALETGTITLTD